MAQIELRLPQNVPGEFFVDSSCIDCDACRQIAPGIFRSHGDQSSVGRQPESETEVRRALMALVACPTASIGSATRRSAKPGVLSFPEKIVDDVYFCGFTAESSFGAWSYLIVRDRHRGGNVLVDSPRFTAPLVRQIEKLGGVKTMFLSHRDDIADHARFAAHFGCDRITRGEDGAARLNIERVLTDNTPVSLDDELTAIFTPGHTRGHQVLAYRNKILFTGDHLAWSPNLNTLIAFRDACWYSWPQQIASMEKLLSYSFEWVLPGHGRIGHDSAAGMHARLESCIEWMKQK